MRRFITVPVGLLAFLTIAGPFAVADSPDSFAEIEKRAREARKAAADADCEYCQTVEKIRKEATKKREKLIEFEVGFQSRFESLVRELAGKLENQEFYDLLDVRTQKTKTLSAERDLINVMEEIDKEKAWIVAARKKLEKWDPAKKKEEKEEVERGIKSRDTKIYGANGLAEKARNHTKERDSCDRAFDDKLAASARAVRRVAARQAAAAAAASDREDLSWMRGALHQALYGRSGH